MKPISPQVTPLPIEGRDQEARLPSDRKYGPGYGPSNNQLREALKNQNFSACMAEREGFEPPIGLHLCRISSAVHSTTLPPLRAPRQVILPAVGPCSRRGWRARQGGRAKISVSRESMERSLKMAHLAVLAGGAVFYVARRSGYDRCGWCTADRNSGWESMNRPCLPAPAPLSSDGAAIVVVGSRSYRLPPGAGH